MGGVVQPAYACATLLAMKVSLKLPNGATLEFDGDSEEFARLQSFLAEPPEAFAAAGDSPANTEETPGEGENGDPGAGGNGGPNRNALDPGAVEERLNQVGARTDIERVTVMAQLALEAGLSGIDYTTVDRLYTELGLPKPSRYTKAFSNAKVRNMVRNVSQGIWAPTYIGQNYARGLGRGRAQGGRRAAAPRSPQLPLTEEGDDA